tara:strand:+ start:114 stop:989 length:876 start_codon:yes stop_codon:yes gene_type:complete
MRRISNITDKMVLGTAQFGMDYGIANVAGKPAKQEVYEILEFAWDMGIRRYDTAPSYGSEKLLGEFIAHHGIESDVILLTKLSGLKDENEYKSMIKTSLESSLNKLGCNIEVLFFHDPKDFNLLIHNSSYFKRLLNDYPISTLGVSVYEPDDIKKLEFDGLELAFQFPFNVLDRRFEKVDMPTGKRYARSIFLQGLLASTNNLRLISIKELVELHNNYHNTIDKHNLEPIGFAISFAVLSEVVDYFLIGVDSVDQLQKILESEPHMQDDISMFDALSMDIDKHFLDPRNWS